MSIGIYTNPDPTTLISQNGAFTNALLVSLNGRLGGVFQKRLFVRNSESNKSYSSIQVLTQNPSDPTLVNGTKNIHWKLLSGDQQPDDLDWDGVSTGNTISIANIGTSLVADTTTYIPFWLYVRIPRNTNVETLLGVRLVINANELLVV